MVRRDQSDLEAMLGIIHPDAPSVTFADRLPDIGVMHTTVTSRAKYDEEFGSEAVERRILGQVEQVMDLAVPLAVPHHEAEFATELAG
jgi:hypothetical protein